MVIYDSKEITDKSDTILGFSFGEILADPGVIVMDVRVRTIENGMAGEGTRGAMLTQYHLLSELLNSTPVILDMMVDQKADIDVLPPPFGPIPHWNSGRTAKQAHPELFFCEGFGFKNVFPQYGSVVAYIEASSPNSEAEIYGADYLLPFRVLRKLQEHLPKVLRKMEQKGISKQGSYFS